MVFSLSLWSVSLQARSRNAARPSGTSVGCLRLGHDRLNIEVIKTSLDALAGIRPCQPGHMRPGIPHLFAGGNGAVMQVLRWARPRPSAAYPLEGPQLRTDGGSEMSVEGKNTMAAIYPPDGLAILAAWNRKQIVATGGVLTRASSPLGLAAMVSGNSVVRSAAGRPC
jgi:hypothetical protein